MTNFDLRKHAILLTVAGSRAYGMETPTSVLDVKGVMVPPKEYYMGTKTIEQVQEALLVEESFWGDLTPALKEVASLHGMEGTVFEVRKFLALAAGANPNILDVLFTRDEDVIYATAAGRHLRNVRHRFLTKKCLHTFIGYATSQAHRIETHRKWLLNPLEHEPTREEFGLPAQHAYPKDQIMAAIRAAKKQVDHWCIDFKDVDEATKIFINDQLYKQLAEVGVGTDEKFTAACNLLGYETNFIDFVQKQRQYDMARDKWKSFNAWKKGRNKKRAGMEKKIGYDVKHAAHLWRLTIACRTIFESGDLHVYDPNPYVLAIRNGEVKFDELMSKFRDEKDALSGLAVDSSLPKRVDMRWLDDLSVDIVSSELEKHKRSCKTTSRMI